jgi:hypothetical protein
MYDEAGDVRPKYSYGSEVSAAVGDIVQVQVAGEWETAPFTVLEASENGTLLTVKKGYNDGLGFNDSLSEGMVLTGKRYVDEVRSGAVFKKQVEGGASRFCGGLDCLCNFLDNWCCGRHWAFCPRP